MQRGVMYENVFAPVQYCIEHGRDTLLREWDAARNGGLTPSDVSFGSHQKVWWQCSKGHSWQAKVYSRSAGSGCPYCTGRKEVPENSLAIQVPALRLSGMRRKTPR